MGQPLGGFRLRELLLKPSPFWGLDGHLVLCTIVSNRAGGKPAGSLTIGMDVVWNLGGGCEHFLSRGSVEVLSDNWVVISSPLTP